MTHDGFQAVPSQITHAGGKLEAIADQLTGLDLRTPVSALGDALPGGSTPAAAGALATTWSDQVTSWAENATTNAESWRLQATHYEVTDDNSAFVHQRQQAGTYRIEAV